VFDRLPDVGGRTSALVADGYRFDRGPTFFLYPQILREIFASISRDLLNEVPMVRLDPQYRLAFGAGGTLDATADTERMRREIAKFSRADAERFPRFLSETRRKFHALSPALQMPWNGWGDLLRPELLAALPHLRPWQSVEGELRRYFEDERLRIAFSFQSKYLGMSPFRCPSLFSILSFLEYEYGVFHPIGGCSAVMEGMARIAVEMGVEFHLGEPVEQILFEGRRAVGVRTPWDTYRSDKLVINADFARAMHRLVPPEIRRHWTDRKIKQARYSCSTFMLYLGLEGRQEDLPHHTIHIAEDYRGNLEDIERRHVLSDDPSFYVQNACVTDPTLAPSGHSTLYVLVPVTHQHPNVDWAKEGTRFRKLVLRRLAKVGLVDVERRIRFEHVVTPADWDSRFEIHLGATFNLAHNLGQMLHLRPRNRFEDLDSVYLVGGGTHPGSGLPVIFESARISSRQLLEDLEVAPRSAEDTVPSSWAADHDRHHAHPMPLAPVTLARQES
jgi:phytoene desaturase